MSFLSEVTPLLLTHNEEPNIRRTLDGVNWAKRIVVVDSGSTDRTIEIVKGYPQAELLTRSFDSHQAQWNFGLQVCGATSNWILALDADYNLNDAFRTELTALQPANEISGFKASFRYCVYGWPLRGNLYPPVTVLFRHRGARYLQVGHTQRVVVNGVIGTLKSPIDHDDRKPLARWFISQQRYAKLEAAHLVESHRGNIRPNDRIRRMGWPAPVLVFFYTLIVKRCLLDGWPGWFYVLQRTIAETMIALEVVDRRLQKNNIKEDKADVI